MLQPAAALTTLWLTCLASSLQQMLINKVDRGSDLYSADGIPAGGNGIWRKGGDLLFIVVVSLSLLTSSSPLTVACAALNKADEIILTVQAWIPDGQ